MDGFRKLSVGQQDPVSGSLLGKLDISKYRFLRERWEQVPMRSGDQTNAIGSWTSTGNRTSLANAFKANRNFTLVGTSAVGGTAAVLNASGLGGISLVAKAQSSAQAGVFPFTLSGQTQWKTLALLTQKEPVFETMFKANALTVCRAKFGLVLTAALNLTTDNDQVFLWFDSATSATNLYLGYSIGGTDYLETLTNPDGSAFALAAGSEYLVQIYVNADCIPEVFIYTDGGPVFHFVGQKALTTAITLLPYSAVQTMAAAGTTWKLGDVTIGRKV